MCTDTQTYRHIDIPTNTHLDLQTQMRGGLLKLTPNTLFMQLPPICSLFPFCFELNLDRRKIVTKWGSSYIANLLLTRMSPHCHFAMNYKQVRKQELVSLLNLELATQQRVCNLVITKHLSTSYLLITTNVSDTHPHSTVPVSAEAESSNGMP